MCTQKHKILNLTTNILSSDRAASIKKKVSPNFQPSTRPASTRQVSLSQTEFLSRHLTTQWLSDSPNVN